MLTIRRTMNRLILISTIILFRASSISTFFTRSRIALVRMRWRFIDRIEFFLHRKSIDSFLLCWIVIFFFEILIACLHSSLIVLISTSFKKQRQNVVINSVFFRFVQFVSDDQSNFVMRELWLWIYIDFQSISSSTIVVF